MKALRLAIVFAVAFFIFTPTAANAQINAVLRRMESHSKSLKSLKCDIRREIYNAQLKETDNYTGEMVFRPRKNRDFDLLLTWMKPTREILSVVKGKYELYAPFINRVYTGKLSDNRVKVRGGSAIEFLSFTRSEIKAKFNVYMLGRKKVGRTTTVALRLSPKDKSDFRFAEVWIDRHGMPIQIKVTKNNNDTDTIRFSGIKKNRKIDGNLFKLKIPKRTEVVRG